MPLLSPPILVGMPHLSYGGLSENWLLKECGHLHWVLLANELGLPAPDFRDSQSNRLYAAFTAVRLDAADLGTIREHDQIRIGSSLARVSRTQFRSSHVVECGGRARAMVEMLSVFLRRTINGNNRSVQRGSIVERMAVPVDGRGSSTPGLVDLARMLRTNGSWDHHGFRPDSRAPSARFRFMPCPRNDFNGAEFLYFANFQAVVDRAEWEWWRETQTQIIARELYFHGNLDIGESLTVVLCALRRGASAIAHWCEIVRDGDGRKIADVFTTRALSCGLGHVLDRDAIAGAVQSARPPAERLRSTVRVPLVSDNESMESANAL